MFDSMQAYPPSSCFSRYRQAATADAPRHETPLYSRTQAIRDGMLIDVTPLAREVGFRDAVAFTRRALIQSTGGCSADQPDFDARLLLLLFSAASALRAQSHRRLTEVDFTVHPPAGPDHGPVVALKIIAGPGDRGETVLTILSVDD
ncbi:MAG: hypothetical protein K0U79_14595 [Gammaproteobacteria bacterium]|nr:hypothetical protein [Gammaproteobacteria bacterium]